MTDPRNGWSWLADRPAGSPGERAAADWLVTQLRQLPLQVWQEPFDSHAHPRGVWVILLGCALWAAGLAQFAPLAVVAVAAAAALASLAQLLGWWNLSRLLGRRRSQNVVAVLPCQQEVRQRVVVVAHYDRYVAEASPWAVAGAALLLALLPLLLVARPFLPDDLAFALRGAALVVGLVLLLALLRPGERRTNDAGIAAGLLVARGAGLRETEVWTVFTGSRGPGGVGLSAFLDRHGRLLEDGLFLVLEEAAEAAGEPDEAALLTQRGFEAIALALPPDGAEIGAAAVRRVAEEVDRIGLHGMDLSVVHSSHEQRAIHGSPGSPRAGD